MEATKCEMVESTTKQDASGSGRQNFHIIPLRPYHNYYLTTMIDRE